MLSEQPSAILFSPADLDAVETFMDRYSPFGFRFETGRDLPTFPESGYLYLPTVSTAFQATGPAFIVFRADPTCVMLSGEGMDWREEPFASMDEALAAASDLIAEIGRSPVEA